MWIVNSGNGSGFHGNAEDDDISTRQLSGEQEDLWEIESQLSTSESSDNSTEQRQPEETLRPMVDRQGKAEVTSGTRILDEDHELSSVSEPEEYQQW